MWLDEVTRSDGSDIKIEDIVKGKKKIILNRCETNNDLYRSQRWANIEEEGIKMKITEMKMLRWICGMCLGW